MIRVKKAAEISGYTDPQIRTAIKLGRLPCIQKGRSIWIDEKDLEDFVKNNTKIFVLKEQEYFINIDSLHIVKKSNTRTFGPFPSKAEAAKVVADICAGEPASPDKVIFFREMVADEYRKPEDRYWKECENDDGITKEPCQNQMPNE